MGTRPARWVPRENSFFRETLGESAPVGPSRDWGKVQGRDPLGVVEGPCGYPAG